jgi:hypothetical protein
MAQAAQFQASSILYNRDVYTSTTFEGKTNLYWATRELRRSALWLAQAYESDTSILIGVGADFQMFPYFGRAENAPYVCPPPAVLQHNAAVPIYSFPCSAAIGA